MNDNMTPNPAAAIQAYVDQKAAEVRDSLDALIAGTRPLLDGNDEAIVVAHIAKRLMGKHPAVLAGVLAAAAVRLAKADNPSSLPVGRFSRLAFSSRTTDFRNAHDREPSTLRPGRSPAC